MRLPLRALRIDVNTRLCATLLAALLAGCATAPGTRPGVSPAEQAPATADAAASAEAAGDYVVAAQEYERLAEGAAPPLKQRYQLAAVEALLKGGQTATARQKLQDISVAGLDPTLGARKRIIEARLVLAEGEAQKALAVLDQAAQVPQLSPALLGDLHEVRAQAQLALERPLEAARQYVQRDRYLAGEPANENQLALWRTLESVPTEPLRLELAGTPDPLFAGWIELALAVREQAGNAVAITHAIAQWRARYPEHPAGRTLLDSLTLGAPIAIGRIERIALLLPLTSDYAVAAQAVRDGFLAMHGRTPEPERPRVTIYDLGPDPALAPQVYERAVQEGAQVIVGPLGREAADAIVRETNLAVPTLILSHTDEQPANGARLFQFGLPPEQEARQAAERAYLDGCRQAAILYPAGAWGERLMNAFSSYWQRLGGIVLANQPYAESETDYSNPIKRLLNIHESESRRRMIEKQIGYKLAFEARPRQDVECIFLAAGPRAARLIKPQLNYHRALHLPVYSTSHIYTGKPDPVHDTDLDGIQFGDMPWMLVKNGRIAQLRKTLQIDWPYVGTDLDRLYALGIDSYAILPHLNRISTDSTARYPGVTSGLSLDRDGRLHRQLTWARFRSGIPRVISDQPQ